MPREYRYISADSHLEVDSKHWSPRVPERYRDRAPRVVRLADGGDAWLVEGRALREVPTDLYGGKGREVWQPFGQNYETTPGTGPATQRLQEQDVDGIDAEVLFPGVSGPSMWRAVTDDDAYVAVVRGYNDFLAQDYCSVAPDRLIGLGAIPWTGVDDAIREMERCKKMGLKGVAIQAFPSGKGQPTREDDKFWAAALDLQMPIAVHEEFDRNERRGGPLMVYPNVAPAMAKRVNNPLRELAGQVARFARLGGLNAVQLILDGVFDRFPDLRIFFAETQLGWIPFFLEMADVRYERHKVWGEELLGLEPLQALPSEYVKQFCHWGFQHDQIGLDLRHHIGVDHIMWATDFPHQDSEWPHSMELVARQFANVPEDEKRKMVAGNAIDYFHLDAVPA
jgi:predicted TIM-barrel fold metal-dependent hydrolase